MTTGKQLIAAALKQAEVEERQRREEARARLLAQQKRDLAEIMEYIETTPLRTWFPDQKIEWLANDGAPRVHVVRVDEDDDLIFLIGSLGSGIQIEMPHPESVWNYRHGARVVHWLVARTAVRSLADVGRELERRAQQAEPNDEF